MIQAHVWPYASAGRNLVGISQTGPSSFTPFAKASKGNSVDRELFNALFEAFKVNSRQWQDPRIPFACPSARLELQDRAASKISSKTCAVATVSYAKPFVLLASKAHITSFLLLLGLESFLRPLRADPDAYKGACSTDRARGSRPLQGHTDQDGMPLRRELQGRPAPSPIQDGTCSRIDEIILLFDTIVYSTLLYSTLLYCTLLYSTLLYSTLLYSTILYYTILYYTILYYTVLYCTILYYTILYYTILYYTILYYTILYYTILYYTILYYTILFMC